MNPKIFFTVFATVFLAGHLLSQFINEKTLQIAAGFGFLLIGGFLLLKALG